LEGGAQPDSKENMKFIDGSGPDAKTIDMPLQSESANFLNMNGGKRNGFG